ncbi:MAG: ATP-binding cassette domain-containing protein [Prevotella sp.]|nr:ATP-binding cassette domain-containing protein [Prevotella sp.]
MKTIKITNGITRKPEWAMAEPVNFELGAGEHIAIVGRNGAGKSMLVDMITSRHPLFPGMAHYDFGEGAHELVSDNIKYIAFRDTYGGDNDRTYFLQQRWNQMEIDSETPTVGMKLEEAFKLAGQDTPERRQLQRHIYELFRLDSLLDKYIILLSSGELRKFKLAASLFSSPRVLIMDNPFIGLDAETRGQLTQLLAMLSEERHLQIIIVLSKTDEIPDFITHIVEVKDMQVLPKTPRQTYLESRCPTPPHVLSDHKRQAILDLKKDEDNKGEIKTENPSDRVVIGFRKVSIRYGERTILKDLDWEVRNGEHWVLSGQNGSGKSTLLSLVCADNPQSYACDISLFGHQRGSGESIWEVKRHIGYVSPEMHRSYQRDMPVLRIVASGLKDSVGLYAKATEEELEVCRWWLHIFGIEHLADHSFMQLSSGEQRLALLARAFVKDPDLLILDEPLHGLDNQNRRLVKDVIEAFCQRQNKTLIFVSHYQEEWPDIIDHELHLTRHG